jgi:metal-responsive CopG/Arc/MetJ family transcriptional regulator
MPRTKRKAIARKNVRIPEPIIDEVDRIVRDSGLYANRQQFIESAIRERIEESRLSEKIDADFVARVRDAFLMHAIVNTVKEKTLPTNHSNLKELEEYVRWYVEKKAERESKRITKEQLDELAKYLSEYHKIMLEGVSPKDKP